MPKKKTEAVQEMNLAISDVNHPDYLAQFKKHASDNGSSEYQIGITNQQISMLQGHVAKNHKDVDAKRSLLKKVAKRRSLLRYLKNTDLTAYMMMSEFLKLKV